LVTEQLRLFLAKVPQAKKTHYFYIIFLIAVHLGLIGFLCIQKRDLISSYGVVGLSFLFFLVWFHKPIYRKRIRPWMPCFFLIFIIIQPLEVYRYLADNYVKDEGRYRYGETKSYLRILLPTESLHKKDLKQKESNSNVIVQKVSSNIYFSTKWYYRLFEKLNPVIFEAYKDRPFLLYDVAEWVDPEIFLSNPDNIERMERIFKENENRAFVSLNHAQQLFEPRISEINISPSAQIPKQFSQKISQGFYKFTEHDFLAPNKTEIESLRDVNELIKVINQDVNGEKVIARSLQEGVDWINDTEKPIKFLQGFWDELQKRRQGFFHVLDVTGGVLDRISRKYGISFSSMSNEQLRTLVKDPLGQELKRLILEFYYHAEIPRSFRVLDVDTNSLKLRTHFSTPKFLVHNNTFHSGWQAFIDGKKEDLFQANIAFRGVWVPAGDHIIEFRFGQKWQHILKYFMMGLFQFVFLYVLVLTIKSYRSRVQQPDNAFQKEPVYEGVKKEYVQNQGRSQCGWVRWLYQGVPVIYLALFLLSQGILDKNKVEIGVKGRILNKIAPRSFDDLVETMRENKGFDRKQLEQYKGYYKQVTESFPKIAETYGMLGFCHYYLGEYKEAEAAYKQAIKRNPHFFWFYHNLGVMYFSKGYYKEAVQFLSLAMKTNPKNTLKTIHSSRMIYIPIMRSKAKNLDYSMKGELQKGLKHCYKLLILIKAVSENEISESELKKYEIKLGIY